MVILGTIFQGNKAINTTNAYHIGTGDYCTAIWDSIAQNITNLVYDETGAGMSHASVGTVIGPAAPKGLFAFEGNVNDSSGNGKNGTNYGATFVTGAIGTQAAQFNGTTAYVRIPRTISTNFSIACWVKTNTPSYGSGQWCNGKGLIDGYVSPTANDFGTAVVAGKVAFGVGNPKTTLASTTSINNGAWHHVAATRDSATGQMRVYVDGGVEQQQGHGSHRREKFPSVPANRQSANRSERPFPQRHYRRRAGVRLCAQCVGGCRIVYPLNTAPFPRILSSSRTLSSREIGEVREAMIFRASCHLGFVTEDVIAHGFDNRMTGMPLALPPSVHMSLSVMQIWPL